MHTASPLSCIAQVHSLTPLLHCLSTQPQLLSACIYSQATISDTELAIGQSIKDAAVGEKEAKVRDLLKEVGDSKGTALLSKLLFLATASGSKTNPPDNNFAADVQKLFADCNTKDTCNIDQPAVDALFALKCHGGLDDTALHGGHCRRCRIQADLGLPTHRQGLFGWHSIAL